MAGLSGVELIRGQANPRKSRVSWLASHLSFVDGDMRTIAVLEAVILFTEHVEVAVH